MGTTAEAYIYDAGEGEARWMGETATTFLATGALTGEAFGLVEERAIRGEAIPLHMHDDVESFYVLEGQVRFFSEGSSWVLGPGGFAFLPRGVPHGFRTEGDVPSRSLLQATPGGFERFVGELSSETPPAGPPDMDALLAAAARHGLDILGPLPE